jgi:hypothetical protein
LLLFWVGVHCGIYKNSYTIPTISYLNSPLSLLPFIPPSSDSWNSFNRNHFSTLIHVYIFFALYYSPTHLFLPPPPPTGANPLPWARLILPFCSLILQNRKEKKKNMTFMLVWGKDSYTGSFLVIFPCIYVL